MQNRAEPWQRRPLIWITDDSPVEARLTETALGPEYDYEHFADGSLVVERLAAADRQPDVLVLDWVMPTMSGDEVCRFLRSRPATAELPIIIVTASRIETKDVVEGLSIGANDYVARPFVAEELRARVATVIRAKRMRERAARERARLATIGRLGRAFIEAGPSVGAVLDALATTLAVALCDGCAVTLLAPTARTVAHHRSGVDPAVLSGLGALTDPTVLRFDNVADALAKTPPVYHAVIRRFGMSGLAVVPLRRSGAVTGIVTVMRDGHSVPFEPDDIETVETCVEYAAIAVENAHRFEAERAAERAATVERERALEFQQYVLGIVGHDLRNPLAAILMGCEMLRARAVTHSDVVSIAERLLGSSTRMQRIVDQLLDVARSRLGGGFPVDRTETDLKRVVSSVIDELALAYPHTRFEPKLESVEGAWDADRLAQVVSNLIGNAIQHGAAESPVWVEAAGDGDDALIQVRNVTVGAPISKEQETTIFEPFHTSSAGSRSGLGLGLYIASEIMRAHRGQISIHSNAATTTFTVRLPRHRTPE